MMDTTELKDEVERLKAICDEHGFVARVNLAGGRMAAVELSLFGEARLHVFPREMLGESSDQVFDYDGPISAFAEMLSMTKGRDPVGYKRARP